MAASAGKAIAVGMGAAVTAFGGIAAKALQMGGDLEQSLGGIETLFKDSADIVIGNAEKAYLTAGVNANDYMQQVTSFSASLLQSLGGDTEAAAKVADMAIIDMADNANKMGTAVENVQSAYQGFAKQNYTMLDNLKLGYGGTKTEMERLLADAEKLSGVKYDISNLNDVYQAIHVIQVELDITGTTAKEGMETLTGSLATAKGALDNFLSGAGDIDAVVSSFSNLADVVVENVDKLLPRLTNGITGIVNALAPKIPGIVDKLLPPIIKGGVALITGLVKAITDNIPMILSTGKKIASALLDGIGDIAPFLKPVTSAMKLLVSNIESVVTAIAPLTAAFIGFKAGAAISSTIDAFSKSLKAAQAATAAASAILATSTTIHGAFAAAATSAATAEAVRTAAKKAGMTIDAAGNLITAAGTAATTAETIAVLTSSGALSAKTVVMGVLTGSIGFATAAQWLWNAAMAANPIGLVIAGVAALVAGIVVLVSWLNKESEEQKALRESTEALIEKNEELLQSINDTNKAYEDTVNSIVDSAAATEKLADRIFDLAKKENKSATEKQKLAILVDQLNKSIPDLNLALDEEGNIIGRTEEEVKKLVLAWKEEAKQQAVRERAIELSKEQMELEEQLNDVKRQQTELEKAKNEGLYDGLIASGKYNDAVKQLFEQEVALNLQLIEVDESLTLVAETQVESAEKRAAAEEDLVERVKSAADIQSEIVAARQAEDDELTAKMIENANALGLTLDEYKEKLKQTEEEEAEIAKKRGETLQKYTDLALDMFDKIETKSKVSVTQMAENLEHNQKVIDDWGDNILKLEGKIDQGLLDKLKEAGPESAATVNELVNANDKELSRLNTVFATGTKTATDALLKQLGLPEVTDSGKKMVDDIATSATNNKALENAGAKVVVDTKTKMDTQVTASNFPSIGENIIKGVISGLDSMAGQLEQRVQSIMSRAAEAARAALEVKSPSRVFAKIGAFVGEGFIQGLDSMSGKVDDAVSDTFSGFSVDGITPIGAIAGGSASVGRNSPLPSKIEINNTFIINSELDIQRISNQLARQTETAMRTRGILAT